MLAIELGFRAIIDTATYKYHHGIIYVLTGVAVVTRRS
jgi:hypothetical protein